MFRSKYSAKKYLLRNRQVLGLLNAIAVPLSSRVPGGIFLFHHGRCGSTVLSSLLNQHPNLTALGEIFNWTVAGYELPASPDDMLRTSRTLAFPSRALVEAKFFEHQHLSLLRQTIDEFVDTLKRCGYSEFIVLNRRNYLRSLVSEKIAKARGGKWHYGPNERVPNTSIQVDIERASYGGKQASTIVELFDYMDEQHEKLMAALGGENLIELNYEEDIFGDPRAAYRRVCDWLGVETVAVQLKTRQSNVLALHESVRNWSEVSRALTGTRHAWMLESH